VALAIAGSKKVLILRLKQAESAMADGRLDEAFDIVQSDSIRQHRRGQKLIGRLARALAKRGQENLEAERTQLALLDEYPEYRFAHSQPAQYAWLEEHYPALFRKVLAAVRESVASDQKAVDLCSAESNVAIDITWLFAGKLSAFTKTQQALNLGPYSINSQFLR